MAVPDFQSLMEPVLRLTAAGASTSRELIHQLILDLRIDEADAAQLRPNGKQTVLANRTHWARWYLKGAGLIEAQKRGIYEITYDGRKILAEQPSRIDLQYLAKLDRFKEWRAAQSSKSYDDFDERETAEIDRPLNPPQSRTPQEQIYAALPQINDQISEDLLARLISGSPRFFESAVLETLMAMGYGRGREDAGEQLGKSGDGGIDGIINEDPLGLDAVYIQAKCYAIGNNVGKPTIQQFVGALNERRASKGVFFTTSDYTKEAIRTAESVSARIMLINGQRLARLMIKHGVGVRPMETITLCEIDENFFPVIELAQIVSSTQSATIPLAAT